MTKLIIDKAKEWCLYAFLFVVPIFYVPGNIDTRICQERFFQAGAMMLASLYFGNIWITLFLWLNLILFAFAGAEVGGAQVLNVFITGILFCISRNYFSKQNFKDYARPFYIVSVLSMIIMIFQVFSVDPLNTQVTSSGIIKPYESFNTLSGLFALPAFNGMYFVITACFLLFNMKRPYVGILMVIPVILSKSSSAIVAFSFILCFWAYFRAKKLFIPMIALMVIGAVSYTYIDKKIDNKTYLSRFENWHLIFKKASEFPLGYGPDSFRHMNNLKNFLFVSDEDYNPILRVRKNDHEHILMYYSADGGKLKERFKDRTPKHISFWQEAHNEPLQFLFEYGIFGVLNLCMFIRELYQRFRLATKTNEVLGLMACLIAYAIISTTQFPFHLARSAGFFGIILGAYFAATDKAYNTFKGE